jgi:hypothetical protein
MLENATTSGASLDTLRSLTLIEATPISLKHASVFVVLSNQILVQLFHYVAFGRVSHFSAGVSRQQGHARHYARYERTWAKVTMKVSENSRLIVGV